MMGKRELVENKRHFILNRILKDQMNFAEQKLLEIQTILLNSYREMLKSKGNGHADPSEEAKQYRLYQGGLSSALQLVKDEIRRSFKENGFEQLGGTEFSSYVKDKAQVLYAIGRNHLGDQYPYEGMIIPWDERADYVQTTYIHKIEDMCFETFQRAKDVKKNADRQIIIINDDFAREINEFSREM